VLEPSSAEKAPRTADKPAIYRDMNAIELGPRPGAYTCTQQLLAHCPTAELTMDKQRRKLRPPPPLARRDRDTCDHTICVSNERVRVAFS